MMPHTIDPITVPERAKNGTSEAVFFATPYSAIMPGTVNPRLAGFMMSMIRAMTSTDISFQCAAPSGASSGGVTTMSWDAASCFPMFLGSNP